MNLWQAMGLEGKRAIIIHHDDLGVTEAQNRAYLELGLPTGSIMMPTAWATQIREGDLGVHMTLNSEWACPRWRPLTGGKSLVDGEGFFPRTIQEAWERIDVAEAEAEMRAQLDLALRLGIDVTHIDTHMGTVLRPDIAKVYHDLALEYRLPALLPESLEEAPMPPELKAPLAELFTRSPLPKFRVADAYGAEPGKRRDVYVELLRGLSPGVYHFIHHAAAPTAEGRQLPDWEGRKADLESLQDAEVRRVLGEFVLLTYRDIRDAMRQYL